MLQRSQFLTLVRVRVQKTSGVHLGLMPRKKNLFKVLKMITISKAEEKNTLIIASKKVMVINSFNKSNKTFLLFKLKV